MNTMKGVILPGDSSVQQVQVEISDPVLAQVC